MKVALVHDYIKEYGGAEKVLETLYNTFPDCTIFTSVYLPSFLGPHKERFKDFRIKTSFLQFLPLKQKMISVFRIISPYVFKNFDLGEFDLIFVSQTGAYFPNLVNKGSKELICYTHTPPRYLYGYKTARQ
ncbi:glycosyltransferase family 4 protein, partial [Patescibacteria group bacterium]|nr:glycosyltransferase family 4 protein [Patescibacteria group bacterium]